MRYNSSNLAIIIPTVNLKNIKKILLSIKRQTKKPGQTIFISNTKINYKNTKKTIFTKSKISNQVHQRNVGLNLINKNIKIILQLDDKFYLHKRAIERLIKEWNSADEEVAGIGIESNLFDENINKFTILKYLTLTGSNNPGKVLISGFNNKLISKKNLTNVDWLQGGLSSWRLKYVSNIFNRNFPIIKWSIIEDLIFSFHIKSKKKYRLLYNKGIKAYVIKDQKMNFSYRQFFYRGYEYARMHKVFVYINPKELSKIAFFYSYIASSFLGVLWCVLIINKKLFFLLG